MIFLLKNWKLLLSGIGILSILGGFLYFKHLINENESLRNSSRQNMEAYVKCYQNQKLIAEKDDAWQKKLAHTNARNADLVKRLSNNATVCVSPGVSYADSTGNEISGQVGIEARTIIDEASACDRNTDQLIELINFIKETR
jgi:hypothetical protein